MGSRGDSGARRPDRTEGERDASGFMGQDDGTADTGLYRLLVESVQDYAIFALDPDGRVLSWNIGAQKLKQYKPEEIIGRHFSIFYPPTCIAEGKPDRELRDAIRDGRVEDEGWRLRKDGSRFWSNVIITALRDSNGDLVGFAKVTRDLTDRRNAEERLRESEERFRLLVHGVKDYAIFMLDTRGIVVSWNEGAQRIKGYAPSEIIGKHFSSFYPAADLEAGKPAWALDVAISTGKYEEEGWRIRKDGTSFWASVLITPIRDSAGRLIGFAKVTRDLTERHAAHERAIADARRITEIEAANRAKSEFLAAMSHELRTPINATLGYSELLEVGVAGELNEQQKGYLLRIRDSQEHLLRIISDLLNYSRIEGGRLEYHIDSFAPHEVVEAVMPMVELQARSKDIAIAHGPCTGDAVGWADRGRTQQIVLNLVTNAVKFTPNGGRITISCGNQGEGVFIAVADTGPGVSENELSAIFEPFVQVGRSLSSGHEGTGLGLAISRDLARAMGGDLTVESEVGVGSTFTVTLPSP